MEVKKRSLFLVVVVALILSLTTALYAASPDFDFYKGKTITYIVATKPGGGYDAIARLVSKYMQKYIPGSTIIVKNVPGAGHIIGTNELYLSKPNGLTIGTFNTGLIYSQIVGMEGIRFDLAKCSWVGKASSEHRVLIVSIKSPFKSIKDVVDSKEPIKMASAGVGTASSNETLILAEALGAPLKVIHGYAGREGEMAMMRGEVVGTVGSYTGLISFIKAKECRVLLQIAGKKHKDLSDVPLASELKISDRGKKLVSLVAGTAELGRFTAGPPNVPAGRLAVLIDAYKKALTDPEFLKDAEKMGADIDPDFGEEVAKLVREAVLQPQENIMLLKNTIKIE